MNITTQIAKQIGGEIETYINENKAIQFYANDNIFSYLWRDSRFIETSDMFENKGANSRKELIEIFKDHLNNLPSRPKELTFYNRPFHQAKYGTWVYDANTNFIFQFDDKISKEERDLIIFRLNALDKNTEEIPDYNLQYDTINAEIKNNGKPFIEIRGWGNLTGTGANNFSAEKASRIQDDLANWIIDRLTK